MKKFFRNTKNSMNALKYQYIGIFLALIFVFGPLHVFDFGIVQGRSMNPTFQNGQFIIGLSGNWVKDYRYGDIITFWAPDKTEKCSYIKRVIATEGDTVVICDSHVYVNDVLLDEPYLCEAEYDGIVDIVVPEDCLFVMGDNRNHSNDSRAFGVITEDSVISKTIFVNREIFP